MENIRQWASGICFAATAIGLCSMIAPRQGTGKAFRLILSLFFLICILYPLKLPALSLEVLEEEFSKVQEISQELIQQSTDSSNQETEKIIAQKVFEILEEEGIIPVRLSIDIIKKENVDVIKLDILIKPSDAEKKAHAEARLSSDYIEVNIKEQEGESNHGKE